MKKTHQIDRYFSCRRAVTAVALLAVSILATGCYTTAAKRDFDRVGIAPWWCQGTPDDLDRDACLAFSAHMDISVNTASQYPTLEDATTAGAVAIADTPDGIGHAVTLPGAPAQFSPHQPQVLLYSGSLSASRIAGVAWRVFGAEPAGFAGDRDDWVFNNADGHWWLMAWVVRGYQNHPNVFAATHPCLASGVTLASTQDACFVASHTEPLEIVVSNDDGYGAEGIYALVDGLHGLANVTVHVVAPLANQSGSSDETTLAPYTVFASSETMGEAPGNVYPVTAVASTDPGGKRNGSGSPADSVLWALDNMNLSPELVISGINDGQNMASLGSDVSGTIGAARTARRNGVAAIGTSAAGVINAVPDFPTSVSATLALMEQWRLGLTADTSKTVLNINTPTCPLGAVQGAIETVVGLDIGHTGKNYFSAADCSSTQTSFISDLEAFQHGYISIADMGTETPPNWP